MEIITGIAQGSDEWLSIRLGWITGSRFKDVMAKGRGGSESKTRRSYMYQLAAETITNERQESFSSEFMEWGNKTEPQARAMYELESSNTADEVAFIKLSNKNKVGISPDGLIGNCGGVEIKCPKTTTQIETFLKGEMPAKHKPQVQGSLWVAGREWWDFVSFDPRIDGPASYVCIRQFRDEEYIKRLEVECLRFEDELLSMVDMLTGAHLEDSNINLQVK